MRLKKETLTVECVLTDPEKLTYSKRLGENISKKQRAEDSLKSFQTQTKAEITGAEAEINNLADKINTGREYRRVECSIEYDWKAKVKRWVRTDTGEIARDDIIGEEELQEHLNFDGKKTDK